MFVAIELDSKTTPRSSIIQNSGLRGYAFFEKELLLQEVELPKRGEILEQHLTLEIHVIDFNFRKKVQCFQLNALFELNDLQTDERAESLND